MRIKSKIGDKRGKLTIKSKEQRKVKNGTVTYLNCQCDCGNEKVIKNCHFKSLDSPNCGCETGKLIWNKRTINNSRNPIHNGSRYIGEVFNNLTVLKLINNTPLTYLCRCSCGKEKEIRFDHLKESSTKSCGCMSNEVARENGKIKFGDASFNSLYKSYKHSAKTRGLLFELNKEQFREITSLNCKYCGIMPQKEKFVKGNNGTYKYNGIDRVDSFIGYLYSNCVPCCSMCNYMKKSYTSEDFLNHINRIYNFQKKKTNKGSGVLTWV